MRDSQSYRDSKQYCDTYLELREKSRTELIEDVSRLREANGVMKEAMQMKGVHSLECQTELNHSECFACKALTRAAKIMGVEK